MSDCKSYFEKPNDWGIAPKSSWVSGTPIGSNEIKMPTLGNPASHVNASVSVSFGDDDASQEFPDAKPPSLFRGKMVKQCPPGTTSEKGICTPDPSSEASLQSRMKTLYGQTGGETDEEKMAMENGREGGATPDIFKRELPEAPKGDPQIARIAKGGYRARGGYYGK
ncbi:hypothetical protein EBT25_10740 [bacterium]|nr:hypothetical protein [bacterium]